MVSSHSTEHSECRTRLPKAEPRDERLHPGPTEDLQRNVTKWLKSEEVPPVTARIHARWPPCLGRDVERQRVRWHDLVLGQWLGLTPEQPALWSLPDREAPQSGPGHPGVQHS